MKQIRTVSIDKLMLFRLLLLLLLAVLAMGLGYAVLSLPTQAPGLNEVVASNLENSGVSNPVTAVLLNFRGYDTLLEMGVLLLAIIAVWSIGKSPKHSEPAPGAVQDMLTRLLVPLLILVAAYLLWVGAGSPGGAFQAGAVLAAAGVLLLLSGWRLNTKFTGFPLRLVLSAGLLVFSLVAVTLMLVGGKLLEYPPYIASGLILLIETFATLSIGVTLVALFLGGRPEKGEKK